MILATLISTQLATAATGYTLQECYEAAIKRSETIATNTELINQAEERYNQAKAAIFPTINGVASYLVQQSASGATATSFSPNEQTTAKLTASQPIFHGMREYAAILQQNLQVTAAMSAKRVAERQLYSDVATNFYTILTLEQDLRDIQNEIDIDEKRIADLNARVRIGRSRISEVLTVKSAVDTLAAQAEQDRGQLLATREAFVFLTGFDRSAPIRETDVLDLSPATRLPGVESFIQKIDDRPDVKSANDNLAATEKNVGIAKGGHLPSVDLLGDYYFKRPGLLENQHWDVQIVGTLPIFQGGAVNSQIRQAVSQTRQAELQLALTRRQSDQEIRADYDSVTADLKQVDRLARATDSAFKNYEAQVKDYRLGLVTNLDVLTATTSAQESQRALDRTRFQSKLDMIKLETAVAERPKGGSSP